jgi:hypothetical protein
MRNVCSQAPPGRSLQTSVERHSVGAGNGGLSTLAAYGHSQAGVKLLGQLLSSSTWRSPEPAYGPTDDSSVRHSTTLGDSRGCTGFAPGTSARTDD